MARVIALVEGVTEETFVNEVLSTHLYAHGCQAVDARRIGLGNRRGGIVDWATAKRDILRHLKQDRDRLVTTMVDFYALPRGDSNGWPGRAEAGALPFLRKATFVEAAIHAEIVAEMGRNFDSSRFLPFVMMYEFEGLLFSNCTLFAEGIGEPELAADFQAIRDQFASPEEINDSPQTAPSKRIEALVPGYTKPLLGNLAALEIGISAILAECPHFRDWVVALKAWCQSGAEA